MVEELRSVFRLEGFEVVTALSGEEGLVLLDEVPAKLVISDQKMAGGIPGTEFLAAVKARDPEIVTMMLTAFSEPEFLMEAVNRANVFQYLLKPWNQEELIHRVSVALRYYHAHAEQRRLARANQRLLERMTRMETWSLFGDFATALYGRFFPVLQAGLVAGSPAGSGALEQLTDRDEWTHLSTVVSRLGEVSSFFHLPAGFHSASVVEAVRRCVEEARRHSAELAVEWRETYEEGLPPLRLQGHTLSIALKALLENAVVFSRLPPAGGPGEVSVRVYRAETPEPAIHIEVADNGPGVADAERPFSPLYTTCLQQSAPWVHNRGMEYFNFEPYNHVGLGLAIARWCITEHDGTLELVNPGEAGACFRITLPLDQEVPMRTSP